MVVWRSIGVRLTAWYMLVLAGVMTMVGIGVWLGLRESVHATVDHELHARVSAVAAYRSHALDAGTPSPDRWIRELAEDSMNAPGNGALQIADGTGHWLYRSPDAQTWPDVPLTRPSTRDAERGITRTIGRRRFRTLTTSLDDATVVEVGLPMHAYDELTEHFFTIVGIGSPLLLAVAAVAGYWLSRRALQPVDAITETARRIGGPTLSARLPVHRSDDELRRLSLTLNEMLGRLEAEDRRTRQFTADASHELRTPVAVIRATADVTSSRARSPDEHQQAWRVVQEQSRRLTKMLEDLLHLAGADARRDQRADRAMDLADQVRDACNDMRVVADHAGLALRLDLPSSYPFRGDPDAIRRLVAALLDNAVKYTPRGGQIRVSLDGLPGTDSVVIQVADTGIGLAADELEHVFDRFYRVSKDRSRETGGAGLGLAIVQSIARQHGGDVSMSSTPGQGCVVRVILPV